MLNSSQDQTNCMPADWEIRRFCCGMGFFQLHSFTGIAGDYHLDILSIVYP